MVFVALLVVAAFVVVLGAVGSVAGARRALPAIAVAVVLAAFVVLVGGGLLGSSRDRADRTPTAGTAPAEERSYASISTPTRTVDLRFDLDEGVRQSFPPLPRSVDGLPALSTRFVEVRNAGLVTLHQCHVVDGAVRRCGPGVPMAPVEGVAVGLIELRRHVDIGRGVDCAVERCVLASADDGGSVAVLAELGFGPPLPTARLAVEPRTGVEPGDAVEAVVAGAAPGRPVTVRWCAAPGPSDPGACDDLDDAVVVEVDGAGRGSARTTMPDRPLGDGRGCTRRAPCALILEVDGRPSAQAVVDLAGLAGPDLGVGQLVAGLVVAALLAGAAVALHRRTDWTASDGDPFAGVSLDVPEWEGVSLEVPEWDDIVPLGSGAGSAGAHDPPTQA